MNTSKNKLTKEELNKISTRLRGRHQELAQRAGVTKAVVSNTFQGVSQNLNVLLKAKEMIDELRAIEEHPDITELRTLIAEA